MLSGGSVKLMEQHDQSGRTGVISNPAAKNGVKMALVFAAMALGLILLIRFAAFMLPFALAFIIAQLLEPLVRVLMRVLPTRRSVIAVIVSLLFFAVCSVLIVLGVTRIVHEASELIKELPDMVVRAITWLQAAAADWQEKLELIHPDAMTAVYSLTNNVYQSALGGLKSVTMSVASNALSLPRIILSVVIVIMATVLIMSGRDRMLAFAREQLPHSWVRAALRVRDDLLGALAGYFKAQAKIMVVVFVELFIGFSILGSKFALLIALGVAVMDALPIFGAGLVLIPSSLAGFITQDFRFGIGCAVMYVCTLALRQLLEPRMLSKEIGLHPLLTLGAMYAGFKLGGVIGLIGGPILVLVLKNLFGVYLDGRTIKQVLAGEQGEHRQAPQDQT